MFLRKGLLCFSILGLLICTGEAIAGPNANAVLSLDLIADGGAGNQRDDGVTSGTVSGQGTKIAVEVFAKGVTTPLIGILVEFDFDASVLTYVRAQSSEFIFISPVPDGTAFSTIAPVTLSESGFLVRAEFTTAVDVTDREFSIGIKKVLLAESQLSSDSLTTTDVITFNAVPSPDVAPSPDFDGDGVVGIPDFLLFVDRFGALRGDGKYDAKYDLDGNGVIGIPDFLIFVDNFGKEVPPSDGGGDAEMVAIPDMNLRAVIEDSLGKASGAPITRSEMVTLTRFAAVNANISDLTGLEFATGLTVLRLSANSIVDISPLSGLTNLTVLRLENNLIVDISPLSGLTNLSLLRLEENSISDVSALSCLTSLEQLNLHINTISDVSALSGLTNLTSLTLYNNSIVDISPLSGLTNLEWLRLRSNSITDLSPLVANTGWGSGDRVDVRDNPLSATSINTHIPVLQDRGVEVSFDPAPPAPPAPDPTPVSIPDANLRAVLEDSLGKASGETITRGDMANLIRLIARNANISDLTGLEFAFNLTRLDLGTEFVSGGGDVNSNHISDLSPLSGLNNLTSLDLERNSISDVSALSGLTSLTTLWLPNNLISDISSLANLTNIWESSFSSNLISDVSPLADWTNLEWLYLNRNSISDVSALSGLTSLKGLGLSDNSISDIAPLSGLTSLTDLSLFSSSIGCICVGGIDQSAISVSF